MACLLEVLVVVEEEVFGVPLVDFQVPLGSSGLGDPDWRGSFHECVTVDTSELF